MAWSLSLTVPWSRRAAARPDDAARVAALHRQRRADAYRRYVAGLGARFGVALPALAPAQLLRLSRLIAEQQQRGLPLSNADLASLAGLIWDLAHSDDTIALGLTQAGRLQDLTATPARAQCCAEVLRLGLAALAEAS